MSLIGINNDLIIGLAEFFPEKTVGGEYDKTEERNNEPGGHEIGVGVFC